MTGVTQLTPACRGTYAQVRDTTARRSRARIDGVGVPTEYVQPSRVSFMCRFAAEQPGKPDVAEYGRVKGWTWLIGNR